MKYIYFTTVVFALLTSANATAGQMTIPNTFTAGTPAVAADMNVNFSTAKVAVDDNNTRIAALEAAIATLQATVATQAAMITTLQTDIITINASSSLALSPYLTVATDARGPLVTISGANVQVVNGQGITASANGLGNLIIGYDESDISGAAHCTIGYDIGNATSVTNDVECTAAGGVWSITGFKMGSHYLVLGEQNNYSSWGGILAGVWNTSNYTYASVSGGKSNTASGHVSSVSGGWNNIARGFRSSVSGGLFNTASGTDSSVSGGKSNTASVGIGSSVSGGLFNTASGNYSSVNGGGSNTASGNSSSINGGAGQAATVVNQSLL